jgi:hypothetical protein
MTQSVYTDLALSDFKLNTSLTVANPSSQDEQSIAQAPTQDPLTSRDRRIIGEIIQVEPETIRTIWIEGGITVWVQFVNGGRLAFNRDWFVTRVVEVKTTLPETPRERNKRLSDELEKACTVFGLYHGENDWLSFSTKLYQDGRFVGFIGCNQQGWYARPRQYGVNRVALSAKEVITSLGVRAAVAA